MIAAAPTSLDGLRVLDLAPPGMVPIAPQVSDRGATDVVECRRPQELERGVGEAFDLILCRNALRSELHPVALLTRLWRLAAPEAMLLVDAEVLAEPELSRYARFVPAGMEAGSPAGWLPGRLALRWMVEASGFDVESWLDVPSEPTDERARLRARRADREPALVRGGWG